jgi:2-oxoglutarate dehydrogenase E2 component (dihydrolipoamide succinyltransferase)
VAVELKVPEVGESITEVQIGEWLKNEGDAVSRDEPIVMIETDKVTVELPAPVDGVISKIKVKKGESAQVGDIVGFMEEGAAAKPEKKESAPPKAATPSAPPRPNGPSEARVMPAAAREIASSGVSKSDVTPTGPGGRMLKEDVQRASQTARPAVVPAPTSGAGEEEIVAMTPMRKRIAERLVEAQQTAALLTTFNEVDMSAVKELRAQYQDRFVQKYGIKLGFMSFFIKAAVDALKAFPAVNAEVRGTDIIYKNHYDIGVAVGGGKGLVVPVIRGAERLSFAEVEQTISDLGKRAKQNTIRLEELQGGTFTISNGGVYGSLLSTPIVNPPQSGILGLHGIVDRPIALNGQVVIRPMMYVALTYDHRIVDGREAVTFLRRIKDAIEEPARLLIEV